MGFMNYFPFSTVTYFMFCIVAFPLLSCPSIVSAVVGMSRGVRNGSEHTCTLTSFSFIIFKRFSSLIYRASSFLSSLVSSASLVSAVLGVLSIAPQFHCISLHTHHHVHGTAYLLSYLVSLCLSLVPFSCHVFAVFSGITHSSGSSEFHRLPLSFFLIVCL